MVVGEALPLDMLKLSEKICLNLPEMAFAGFYHIKICSMEFVRIILVENVRNLLDFVRNLFFRFQAQIMEICKN